MFKKIFGRSEPPVEKTTEPPPAATEDSPLAETPPEAPTESKSWFARLKSGLSKTRQQFSSSLVKLFQGRLKIDDQLFDDIERQLLMSDVGVETTEFILNALKEKAKSENLSEPSALLESLKSVLSEILSPQNVPLILEGSPSVILMIGANGNGKTTTIGKLAHHFKAQGKKVMLAAGDTFRAAAVEQLQQWGERVDAPVISQPIGADSASVVFDALQSAQAKNVDVLIADTAGRLHTRDDLMQELKKIKRVLAKIDPQAPHEVMLVLDAGTGQNALAQAQTFQKEIGLTGITLTKLDGTAKGGVIFSIAQQCQVPIRYIGVGEQVSDLRPFCAQEFVDALFENTEE
ncbi:MAG: signal recognition particle-docking protein FtsY [Legionellales bacterium]|nr:signal recognition particle-docking protein FtsY [Legionellales bacterium]